MKYLIVSGSHEVVVVSDEFEAQKIRQSQSIDKVVRIEDAAASSSAASSGSTAGNVVAFPGGGGSSGGTERRNFDLRAQVKALEEKLVLEAMAQTGNNQVRAAALLGITRGALQYKLRKLSSKLLQAA